MMHETIFREYDIRGIVGTQLPIEEVYRLTQAIVYYLKQQRPHLYTIAVGMDGRVHSPAIKAQVCAAIQDSGVDVMFLGVCPTPVMYFAQHMLPVDAGIMITASHNPAAYNGLKIMLSKHKVWGSQIQIIKQLYKQGQLLSSSYKGSYAEYDVIDLYIAWLKEQFAHLIGYEGHFVIDCGNGATGTVMPRLVQAMEFTGATLLCEEVDGTYPHHEADPTVEDNMRDVRAFLTAHPQALIGVGFDGDGDRMGAMLPEGTLVPGDVLLATFARSIADRYPERAVVFDVKASSNTQAFVEQCGMKPCASPSGHAYIKACMYEHNAILGGELSCHFFFHDRYFGYDDGIYAMMRLIEMIQDNVRCIHHVIQGLAPLVSTPEIRIPCGDDIKRKVVAHMHTVLANRPQAQLVLVDGVQARLPYGTGLIRASNTQPALCFRFESATQEGLEQIQHEFMQELKLFIDEQQLTGFFNG